MVPPPFPLLPKNSTIPVPPNYAQVLKERAAALLKITTERKK
jgi:hypothetical protein